VCNNIFQAAEGAGCRRIIFASSINVIGGYPLEVAVSTNMPVRPANLYGATKAWGESLARFFADTTTLSCICLRFGWIKDADNLGLPPDHFGLRHVLTYADLVRLSRCY
jgi:nucleoside-diphosphate-sugar epimerase